MLIYKEMKGNFILNNSFKLFMINKWIWIIIIKSTNKVDLSKFLEIYYPQEQRDGIKIKDQRF